MIAASEEDYRDSKEVMHDLLALIVKSVDYASRTGIPLSSGGRLHLIPLGNKGDFEFLGLPQASFSKFTLYHHCCES